MAKVLEISATIGCPINCTFCPQRTLAAAYHGPRLMDWPTFDAAMSNTPAGIEVVFAGFSEPFLNRNTAMFIEFATAYGFLVEVYTTGVGMTREDVDVMDEADIRRMTLHLADADGHAHIDVTDDYVDAVTYAKDRLRDVRVMTMGRIHSRLEPIFGQPSPVTMHSRAGNVAGVPTVLNHGALRCSIAPDLDHPVMLPDGRLVLCCMDYGLRHVIGNLAEERWETIMAGPRMAAVRAEMAAGGDVLCKRCHLAEEAR